MNSGKHQTIVILQDDRALWYHWQGPHLIEQRIIPHDKSEAVVDLLPFDVTANMEKRFGRHRVYLIIDSSLDEISNTTGTVSDHGRVSGLIDAASIQESLNRRCQSWLQTVQAQGVIFDKVTSSLRLLVGSQYIARRQTLFVVEDDDMSRHVLLHKGRVIYARQCKIDESHAAGEALSESLDYLENSASPGICDECKMIYVGADQTNIDLLSERTTEAVIQKAHDSALDWYVELFRRQRWRIRNQLLNRALNGQLDRSESRRKLLRNDRRLYIATGLSVFIASITVIVACVHGFTVAKYMRSVEHRSVSLSNEIVLTKQAATAIHASPIEAAESLARFELFERIEYLDAAAVLALVANVVTEHPEIELDRLEWSMTESQEALEWIALSSLEHAAVPDVINQVLSQSIDSTEETHLQLGTQIAIEGSVHDASLRRKQSRFESFVTALEASPNVASVEVLRSPLEDASSSDSGMSGTRFSLQVYHWPS